VRILLPSAALLMIAAGPLAAQSTTAYKTGERTTGMTKQCYYDALGSEHTRTIQSIELCPLSITVKTGSSAPKPDPGREPKTEPAPRSRLTAYRTGEETTGTTKQCHYDGMGSRYTRTVQSYQLCPLSIVIER
jgi:hypothetical protein